MLLPLFLGYFFCKFVITRNILLQVFISVALTSLKTEKMCVCYSVSVIKMCVMKLQDFGVIMLPTVSGPPPKLKTSPSELKEFNEKAFMLQTIAGLSGGCQVYIYLYHWTFNMFFYEMNYRIS